MEPCTGSLWVAITGYPHHWRIQYLKKKLIDKKIREILESRESRQHNEHILEIVSHHPQIYYAYTIVGHGAEPRVASRVIW